MKNKTLVILFCLCLSVSSLAGCGSSGSSGSGSATQESSGSSEPESEAEAQEAATDSETKESDPVVFDFSSSDAPSGEQDITGLSVEFGELLSVINTEGVVVVKTKITSSFSNKATIEQNYYNVAALIRENGFNTCQELQYWAVADMSSGDESKCISFTLDKDTIDAVYNESIVDNQLGNYVTDLWTLPSLQD
jgi:hypothetical protein